MNYFEAFSELKGILEKSKIKKSDGHLAIQVCITDENASGVFYIEDFGDRILAEPYDYYDNNVEIIGQAETLKMLFEKKLDLTKATESYGLTVNGDFMALEGFLARLTKPTVRKTAAKKVTPTSSATKKSASKKTEVKKVTDNNKNKDVKPKDSEPIKEVVEKEIKPKNKR